MKNSLDSQFRRQHGLVTRSDAVAAGLTYRQIQLRVASGVWIEVSPGVYRHPAHPITPEQRVLAAVLGAGRGAVASHQAAAYLWGLLEWEEAGARAAVSVLPHSHPRSHGFDVHRMSDLDLSRVRIWKGVECTDPLWTLADLGAVVDGALVDRAIDRGLATRLITVKGLQTEIARRSKRGRRGVGILRERLMARGFLGAPRPSVLESRTLAFLARYRIPVERVEVVEGPDGEYRVDFSIVHPLMLEVDGYVWHYSPEHLARDHQRRNRLKLAGIELYVSNWLDLHRRQLQLAGLLRQAVSQHRSRTPGRP